MVLLERRVARVFDDDLDLLVTLASVADGSGRRPPRGGGAAATGVELKQARRIQVGLFPQELPELPGYDSTPVTCRHGVSGGH
jgi:hypothetical protein